MDINQLIEIIEQKILSQDCILKVDVQDKSFLHKNHKSNVEGKFHILLLIKSPELEKKNKLDSNRFIYQVLQDEIKNYIHSLQIKLI
jgi:BolA protein